MLTQTNKQTCRDWARKYGGKENACGGGHCYSYGSDFDLCKADGYVRA